VSTCKKGEKKKGKKMKKMNVCMYYYEHSLVVLAGTPIVSSETKSSVNVRHGGSYASKSKNGNGM
jgi:hypothetical protein